MTTPKTPVADSTTKKKAAKPKAKAAATKSGSEEEIVTPKVEEKPPTPAQIKEMKEKKGKDFGSSGLISAESKQSSIIGTNCSEGFSLVIRCPKRMR